LVERCRSFADWDCRNGEKENGLCPFPFSSHRGSGFAASPMTAYRQDMAEKYLYYIEIEGYLAGFLARLTGSYERLRGFYTWLTKFFAPLTKFFAWLTKFYASPAKFYARLAGPCE
jgi:hypothetical protein